MRNQANPTLWCGMMMVLAAATVVVASQGPGQRRLPGRGPGPERVLREPRFVLAAQASLRTLVRADPTSI